MLVADKLTDLLKELPDAGRQGAKADKAKAEEVIKTLLEGGAETVTALVDLLTPPEKGDDVKARHALHALATKAGAQTEDKRRAFAQALAATLDKQLATEVRAFVIRQLQVCGGKEVADVLGPFLLDKGLCDEAAQALLAIGAGSTEQFRKALPKATGRPLLCITQALGVLKDVQSGPALKKLAGRDDQDVRITAVWALANAGDASAVDVVTKASDAKGYERIQGAKSCLLLAENLVRAGRKDAARKVYRHLQTTRTDESERYLKEAASAAFNAL